MEKSIKKTNAWKEAQYSYEFLISDMEVAPMLGNSLPGSEVLLQLEEIIKVCPIFYPALADLGIRRLATKDYEAGVEQIRKAFDLMLKLAPVEHLEEEFDIFIENLEKLHRFDLCVKYLSLMNEQVKGKAAYFDSLAFAFCSMWNFEEAQKNIDEALNLEPLNHHYICNKGYFYLCAGDITKAEEYIRKSLKINPEDKTTKNYLSIIKYLHANQGKTYIDYLLRKVDMEELKRFAEDEDWQAYKRLIHHYNNCRTEAFLLTKTKDRIELLPRFVILIDILKQFFNFVDEINDDEEPKLHEDIIFLRDNFKLFMQKFIQAYDDIDKKIIEDLYEALAVYYAFLADNKLITRKSLETFNLLVYAVKNELVFLMKKPHTHKKKFEEPIFEDEVSYVNTSDEDEDDEFKPEDDEEFQDDGEIRNDQE